MIALVTNQILLQRIFSNLFNKSQDIKQLKVSKIDGKNDHPLSLSKLYNILPLSKYLCIEYTIPKTVAA